MTDRDRALPTYPPNSAPKPIAVIGFSCRLVSAQRRSSVAAGAAEGRRGNPKRASALGGQLQRFVIFYF